MRNQTPTTAVNQYSVPSRIAFKKLVAGIAWLLAGVANAEGPFGVDIGSDPALLEGCGTGDRDGYYTCATLPKTHSAFDLYALRASKSQGICWIKGFGRAQENDSLGVRVRELASELSLQVTSNYGLPSSINDFLLRGSMWDEPNDWMIGVLKGERAFNYHWDSDAGFSPKNRVSEIMLYVAALDSSTGTVSVEFEGDNYEACEKEISDAQASAF